VTAHAADAILVAPTKLQSGARSSNGGPPGELAEEAVISRVGGALAEATSERREAELEEPRTAARRAAVEIASAMLEVGSAETAAHSDDVDVITEGIARRLGFSGQRLDDTILAARLHDIGKLGIPLSIINKPGSLDRGEWKAIRRHTIIGEQILLAVPELRGVAHLVRHSHERWDGDGYPDGLAGEDIPLGSRIVFCADAYHAIRSDRPYREGRSAADALAEVRSCAGSQFDPVVVEALAAIAAEMRAPRNGSLPRATRPRRLMALMLIISVGACGSAFARSGLMPEPPGTGAGTTSTSSGPAGFAAGTELSASTGQLDALNASRLNANPAFVPALGLLSALPPGLALPSDSPLDPGLSEGAVAGSVAGDHASPVRDHGKGIGRGKGKGKGRGAALGRGHQKAKSQAKPKHKSADERSASGNANGHAKPVKSKAKRHAAPTSGSVSTANSKPSSSKGKSAQTGTGGQASAPAPTPKAPKPPKTPAAPDPGATGETPPATGASNGSAGNGGGNGGG